MLKNHSAFKFITRVVLVVLLAGAFSGLAAAQENDKKDSGGKLRPGLLILSHGSHNPKWNGPVSALVERVRQLNSKNGKFHAIQGAFLEFSQPDAAAAIEKLEAAGCNRLIVVPLFIAPSSHSQSDVPAVLGLYTSPSIRQTLKEEGARVAKPSVPIVLTQTLSESDMLDNFVSTEVNALSKKPEDEAIVLLAHGSADHVGMIDRVMRRLVTNSCGHSGISYADWGYCAVGQTYLHNAIPAIQRAGNLKKRVLVIGLYVSSSARRIHDFAMERATGSMATESRSPFAGIDVVFSENGIVDHPETASWLLSSASEVLEF